MIRILRVFNRFIIGGPAYNAFYLTEKLSSQFNCKLITGMADKGETEADFLLNQFTSPPVVVGSMNRSINFLNDYHAYREMRKIIREYRPHIVHTHAAKPGALGRMAAAHEKVPVIIHTFHGHVFHSYFNSAKSQLFIRLEQYLARKTSAIIAISEKQKQELSQGYHITTENKIQVIPLGFNLDRFQENANEKRQQFRREFGLDANCIAIGIIGRLTGIKNHKMFLDAIANLSKDPGLHFTAFIVGDGELKEELIGYANSRSLSVKVWPDQSAGASLYFTSWRKDIDVVINGLDIIALTSLNEGTPVSLIEAQAAGKTVITTDVGGVTDCLSPENIPNVVGVNNTAAFTERLKTICSENGPTHTGREQIRSFVLKKYSYQRLVSDTEALYLRLLEEKLKPADGHIRFS